MAAVAGIMGQELLGVTPVWFNAGTKDYAIPPLPLTAIEFLVLGFLELKRFQGFKEHKTVSAFHAAYSGDIGIYKPHMLQTSGETSWLIFRTPLWHVLSQLHIGG